MSEWISVAIAAKVAGRAPETVRRAIRDGELEARRFGPAGWYSVNTRSLESFMSIKSRDQHGDEPGQDSGRNQDLVNKAV